MHHWLLQFAVLNLVRRRLSGRQRDGKVQIGSSRIVLGLCCLLPKSPTCVILLLLLIRVVGGFSALSCCRRTAIAQPARA